MRSEPIGSGKIEPQATPETREPRPESLAPSGPGQQRAGSVEPSLPPRIPGYGATSSPELKAARLAEAGFDSELDLRRREIIPNPTLGVSLEYEPARASEASRTLLFARVSFPLPVWDRKQAEIRAAESGRGVAAASRHAVERQIAAEVASAHAALAAARSSFEAFTGAVPKVERNLVLLEKAYASGQVSLPELLAAKDRAFATRREIVEAQASLARAFHELRRAVGEAPSETTP
jgi:outer membrane protein TolC